MIDFNDPIGREFLTLVERLKYERWLSSQLDDLLEREFNRVVDSIVSGQFRTLTPFQQQRLAQLFQTLAKRITEAYQEAIALQLSEMKGYAVLESDIVREAIRVLYEQSGTFNVGLGHGLTKAYLTSIAKLPIQGLNIGEWFDAQARTMTLEVRRIIQQGLVDGIGPYAIASKIVAPASAEGPVLLRRAKNEARMVSRTAVNAVQNDAQFATLSALPDSVSDSYVYEAVLDSRTTPICRALSGRVYRYDDPRRKLPPQHIGCVLPDTLVSAGGRITAVSKRWVETKLVVIRTASGDELSCTPNHPILTRRGWVAASALDLSDQVVSDTTVERVLSGDVDEQHGQATIEQIAQAWFERRSVEAVTMPTAAPDFHGDGADSEVTVIGTDRFLLDELDAAFAEHARESHFVGRCAADAPLSFGGSPATLVPRQPLSFDSEMRGVAKANALLWARELHACGLLLAAVASGDAALPENADHSGSADAELPRYSGRSDAREEQCNGGIIVNGTATGAAATEGNSCGLNMALDHSPRHSDALRDGVGALACPVTLDARDHVDAQFSTDANPSAPDRFSDDVFADATFLGESLDAFAGNVTLSKIVGIDRRNYSGHVYNLETELGFYSANNIITHNCRSTIRALLKGINEPMANQRTPRTLKNYSTWLAAQPVSTQNDILGPSRAPLWRSGKLSLADTIDGDSRVLTLKQLRERLGLATVGAT
jgi:SPP1 gp7 family putative phage head morphogenesis protein